MFPINPGQELLGVVPVFPGYGAADLRYELFRPSSAREEHEERCPPRRQPERGAPSPSSARAPLLLNVAGGFEPGSERMMGRIGLHSNFQLMSV